MRKKEQTFIVETPEHFELQFELAGIGTRFIAFLVDRLIQFCVVSVIIGLVILSLYLSSRTGVSIDLFQGLSFGLSFKQWLIGAAILLYGVVLIGYFILFEYFWSGSTPGKRYQQIRVIRKDGRPISLFDSLVRNILRSVDILLEVYPIGLVVMFLDSRARRLGDLAAGTLVIMDRRMSRPRAPSTLTRKPDLGTDLRAVVAAMTAADYYIVSSFLARRKGLDPAHRRKLARDICARLLGNGKVDAAKRLDTETFLQDVAQLYRERMRVL